MPTAKIWALGVGKRDKNFKTSVIHPITRLSTLSPWHSFFMHI